VRWTDPSVSFRGADEGTIFLDKLLIVSRAPGQALAGFQEMQVRPGRLDEGVPVDVPR